MKRLFLSLAASALLVSSFSPASFAAENKKRVIVVFKDEVGQQSLSVQSAGGQIHHRLKNIPAISLTAGVSEIDRLKKDPRVKSVENDIVVKIKGQTTDWGVSAVKAPAVWANGNFTGAGVKIAVLDTGISLNHPDLAVAGGVSAVAYTSSYDDDAGHGTHVAGIIGAKNNALGVVGVSPDAQLYAVKVVDSTGEGYLSDVISGIDWAITNKMDIINLSLGTPTDVPSLHDAVDRAYNSGILVVAAAGNDGNAASGQSDVNYPALYDSAIAVSSVNSSNALSSFSSSGAKVELSAPGESILSTYTNGQYAQVDGTSAAAPFVSGVLAIYKQMFPGYTNAQLREAAIQSSLDLGPPGRDASFGYGLVQAVPKTPDKPGAFSSSGVTQTGAILSWQKAPRAFSYELRRNGSVVYSGTDNSFADYGLAKGSSNAYVLVAKNVSGNSAEATLSVSTPGILSAPSDFSAAQKDSGFVLSWAPVSGASFYTVQRDGQTVYSGKEPLFEDYGLLPSQIYQYSVRAENGGAPSSLSAATASTLSYAGSENEDYAFLYKLAASQNNYYGVVRYAGAVLAKNALDSSAKAAMADAAPKLNSAAFNAYYGGRPQEMLDNYKLLMDSPGVPASVSANARDNFKSIVGIWMKGAFDAGDYYKSVSYGGDLIRRSLADSAALALMEKAANKLNQAAFNAYYGGREQEVVSSYRLLLATPGVPASVASNVHANWKGILGSWTRYQQAVGNAQAAISYGSQLFEFGDGSPEISSVMESAAQKVAMSGFNAYYAGKPNEAIDSYKLLIVSGGLPDYRLQDARANLEMMIGVWAKGATASGDPYSAVKYLSLAYQLGLWSSPTKSLMDSAAPKLSSAAYSAYYAGSRATAVQFYKALSLFPGVPQLYKTDGAANYAALK